MSIQEQVIAACSAAAAVGMYLVGQVAAADGFPRIDVSSMTATGILGWYAWHTASRTIPEIVKEHKATVDQLCGEFRQDMKEERAQHAAEIRELREAFRCQGRE